jgi:hypothetical protein
VGSSLLRLVEAVARATDEAIPDDHHLWFVCLATDLDITKPEESFTVTMNSIHRDRSELHERPEWNNNDYRMF